MPELSRRSRGGSNQYQSPPISVPTQAIEFVKMVANVIDGIDDLTTPQIMFQIKVAMRQMKKAKEYDHLISEKDQAELKTMNDDQAHQGINIFNYAPSSKARLCPMTAPDDE